MKKIIHFLLCLLAFNTTLPAQCWKSAIGGSTFGAAAYGIKTDGTLWNIKNSGFPARFIDPIQIGHENDWKQLAGGGTPNTLAIKNNGSLWSWDFLHIPVQIGNDLSWHLITSNVSHHLAIKTDGTLWAWGGNEYGQLGDGTNTEKDTPTQIGIDTVWAQVSAGRYHTLAIKTDGTLWAWGNNRYGQLGDGTNSNKYIPTQIGRDTNWVQANAGLEHSVAIRTDGTLWAWGRNEEGQLGDSTNADKNAPIQIGIDTGWAQVSVGFNHNLAIKADSTLWAWGYRVSNGTHTEQYAPIQIGSLHKWKYIYAKMKYSLAISSDESLWAWGIGNEGISTGFDYSIMEKITCSTTNSQDIPEETTISISPVPATNEIWVDLKGMPTAEVKLFISTLHGNVVFERDIVDFPLRIVVEDFPTGIYFLTLQGRNSVSYRKFYKF